MSRFRSLRWRLTFLYLGLLAVLLLAAGVAQYFAAREVLFRTNADVLVSEYNAVFNAFRKQNATRPAAALRAIILSQSFADEHIGVGSKQDLTRGEVLGDAGGQQQDREQSEVEERESPSQRAEA